MINVVVLDAGPDARLAEEPRVLATFRTESPIEDGSILSLPVGRPVHVVQVSEAVVDGVWTQWMATIS